MTLYLKYRPQAVSELDLKSVRDQLRNILQAKNLPHAFLFSGVRGTGKTSSARILAKAVNCISHSRERGNTDWTPDQVGGDGIGLEPCNTCDVCVSITNGSCPDVIEIDAASNRGIDEMRSLREQITLAPMVARMKVYIIDEVHMLTAEAANALLKTLEEPPPHALFVLCTTDPDKLPITVVSRCVEVRFGMPSPAEVIEKLQFICEQEGWKDLRSKIEDLHNIVRAARGSFRDAVKLLEQVATSGKDSAALLGMVDGLTPDSFLDLVAQNKTEEALAFVEQLVSRGVALRTFVERLTEVVRDQLLTFKTLDLVALVADLQVCYEQMRLAYIPQLPLEIFILKQRAAESSVPVGQHIPVATVSLPGAISVIPAAVPTPRVVQKKPIREEVLQATGESRLADIQPKWPAILKNVKAKNHSIEALLRSTQLAGFDGRVLTLDVFYAFHKDKLQSEKCRALIEASSTEVYGSPIQLQLVMGNKSKKTEEVSGAVGDDIIAAAAQIFGVEAV